MAAVTATMSALGNKHETHHSITKSAVGANINLDTEDQNAHQKIATILSTMPTMSVSKLN